MRTLLSVNTTHQELFNHVTTHLLRQKQKSMKYLEPGGFFSGNERCAYRGELGLSCAIGACISDDDYNPIMETCSAYNVIRLFFPTAVHLRLLATALQATHDAYDPKDWLRELKAIAKQFKLELPSELQ